MVWPVQTARNAKPTTSCPDRASDRYDQWQKEMKVEQEESVSLYLRRRDETMVYIAIVAHSLELHKMRQSSTRCLTMQSRAGAGTCSRGTQARAHAEWTQAKAGEECRMETSLLLSARSLQLAEPCGVWWASMQKSTLTLVNLLGALAPIPD